MSWDEVLNALRKVVLIEDNLSRLNEQVRTLSERFEDVNQRLARLEGKFELLEHMGQARKRLRD